MENPKLRPIQAMPVRYHGRQMVQLFDPAGLSEHALAVPQEMLPVLALFDGTHSITDIQAILTRRFGRLVFSDEIRGMVEQLDGALLLDSERFAAHLVALTQAYRAAPVRQPASAGSGYPKDPSKLRAAIDRFFTGPDGPGAPQPGTADGQVVGLVAPHIDFERGAVGYAHAYKALAEGCDADLFVVLGTAHHANDALYILTVKDFETPLGTMRTNADLVHALAERCPGDPFAEEVVHRGEHSIEFQVVLLQHLFAGRAIELLPVLCGSMELVVGDGVPSQTPAVADFVAALRETIAESGRRACVIAAADLAHVGRQFGHDFDLTPRLMSEVEQADRAALEHVVSLDADAFYETVMLDGNARHICGLGNICTLLATVDAARCELLDYRQAVAREAGCAVTFASVALHTSNSRDLCAARRKRGAGHAKPNP